MVGDVDQDGYVLSRVGSMADVRLVDRNEFIPRLRFRIELVDHDGTLGIRKNYGRDRFAFVNELKALERLRIAGCNVPAVLDVDFERLTTTVACVPGDVLRHALAERGARLEDRDLPAGTSPRARLGRSERRRRLDEGRHVVREVVDEDFVNGMFHQMQRAHRAGVVLHDVKYGNVVIERGSREPVLIDFDDAGVHGSLPPLLFRFLRDGDYAKFNDCFATTRPTHERVREMMRHRPAILERVDAPFYLPGGLRFGAIWDPDVGYGRWISFLERALPVPPGGRILDLGSNNGFNAIQMLRGGAGEVVAVELDHRRVVQGMMVRDLFEWSDNVRYRLRFIEEDMVRVPEMSLGRFDMVTALCSLHHLGDQSMRRLVRHLSGITGTVVLQCNLERTSGRDPQQCRRASVPNAVEILQQEGFPTTEVVAPTGYVRPLVVGRTRAA